MVVFEETTYQAEQCGAAHTDKDNRTREVRGPSTPASQRQEEAPRTEVHGMERPHECEQCGVLFTRHDNLLRHERRAHGIEKRHKCTDCGAAFDKVFLLNKHVRASHGIVQPAFVCHKCDTMFRRLRDLMAHKRFGH
ncbi:hypothetical protein HPB52_010373 [Rhipicephalus sanguineus]|uniref:C2H2-type domain-containing protein n=1 Tax=Rhipicephalus sanguineus TaxID=34632 RepID=A0A9D4SW23_RHISA|nr:hypothetical protein HPB52_010373 [Rhipicephalus sanguineus]